MSYYSKKKPQLFRREMKTEVCGGGAQSFWFISRSEIRFKRRKNWMNLKNVVILNYITRKCSIRTSRSSLSTTSEQIRRCCNITGSFARVKRNSGIISSSSRPLPPVMLIHFCLRLCYECFLSWKPLLSKKLVQRRLLRKGTISSGARRPSYQCAAIVTV